MAYLQTSVPHDCLMRGLACSFHFIQFIQLLFGDREPAGGQKGFYTFYDVRTWMFILSCNIFRLIIKHHRFDLF
jgi:hypothetical protein